MPCGTREKKTKWVAVVVADRTAPYPTNLLLGGVSHTEFSPQEYKADAEYLAKQCKETNEQAGRKVARTFVRPVTVVTHRPKNGRKARLSR